MYLSHIMQKKEALVRDEVNGGYSQTTMVTGAHLLSPGESTKYPMGQKHIFNKFEAFCIQWYHFQLKIPIRNVLNRIFKTLNIFLRRSIFGVLARQKWKLLIFIILVFGVIRSSNNMKVVLILKDFKRRFHLYQF